MTLGYPTSGRVLGLKVGMCGNRNRLRFDVLCIDFVRVINCSYDYEFPFRFLKTRTEAKRSNPKFWFPWLFSKPNLSFNILHVTDVWWDQSLVD